MTKDYMNILIVVPASIVTLAMGVSIGSFINVVAYRLPARLSVLWPASRCPRCLTKLKAYDNVPVLAWVYLKGRCRYCQTKISIRYPVVEGITGIIFLLIFWQFQASILTVGYWAFSGWLLALALIDLDTMTLPNVLTKSGLVVGICFQMAVGFFLHGGWVGLLNHLIMGIGGAVLGLWLFDAIAIFASLALGKTAMGAGDAKLAAMMGAWLGWKYLLVASFIACVVGVIVAGGAMVLSKQQMGQKIPFGPFLAMGAIITLFTGEGILSTYLGLFFL